MSVPKVRESNEYHMISEHKNDMKRVNEDSNIKHQKRKMEYNSNMTNNNQNKRYNNYNDRRRISNNNNNDRNNHRSKRYNIRRQIYNERQIKFQKYYANYLQKKHNLNDSNDQILLKESCSLPKDDDLLRAASALLDDEPGAGDGYSSDNIQFYGQIKCKRSNDNKQVYLKKLGNKILTKSLNDSLSKITTQYRSNNSLINNDSQPNIASLGNIDDDYDNINIIKKVQKKIEMERELSSSSSNLSNKAYQAEIDRKEIIRTRCVCLYMYIHIIMVYYYCCYVDRQMMRRKKPPKSRLFWQFGSIQTVYCNYVAITLGFGILCSPFVFTIHGWSYGLIVLICIGLLQMSSSHLLIQCQNCTSTNNYFELMKKNFDNKPFMLLFNIILFGYYMSQCIGIIIVLYDIINCLFCDIIKDSFLDDRYIVILFFSVFIIVPLSFFDTDINSPLSTKTMELSQDIKYKNAYNYKKMNKKGNNNIFMYQNNRLLDIIYNFILHYFLLTLIEGCFYDFYHYRESFDDNQIRGGIAINSLVSDKYDILYSYVSPICIILFTLTTQIELFSVNKRLTKRKRKYTGIMIHGASIQNILYLLIFGTTAYFWLSPDIKTNIINNLFDQRDNKFIVTGMLFYMLAVFSLYPGSMSNSRKCFINFLKECFNTTNDSNDINNSHKYSNGNMYSPHNINNKNNHNNIENNNNNNNNIGIMQYVIITFLIAIIGITGGILITDLGYLITVSGCIFCSFLCLIFPGVIFYKILIIPSNKFIESFNEFSTKHPNLTPIEKFKTPSLYNPVKDIDPDAIMMLNQINKQTTPALLKYTNIDDSDVNYDESFNGNNYKHTSDSRRSSIASGISFGPASASNQHFNKSPIVLTPDTFHGHIASSYTRLYGDIQYDNITHNNDSSGDDNNDNNNNNDYSVNSMLTNRTQTFTIDEDKEQKELYFNNNNNGNRKYKKSRFKKISFSGIGNQSPRTLKDKAKSISIQIETHLYDEKMAKIKKITQLHSSIKFKIQKILASILINIGIIVFILGLIAIIFNFIIL